MLTHLSIKNFTLVTHLDLDLSLGMSAITGETGAGKSILLDALSLTLGDRADYSRIRKGAERAEVSATFDVLNSPEAIAWLQEQQMDADEQCLLRRTISSNGKSSAWVNGHVVTLNQLRDLAEILINIHSQHEHQALTKPVHHRQLLDQFASHSALLQEVAESYDHWSDTSAEVAKFEAQFSEGKERLELLSFQVNELVTLNLEENEFNTLEEEQKKLSNAEYILSTLNDLENILAEDEQSNLQQGSQRAISLVEKLPVKTANIKEAEELLRSAYIQLSEASASIKQEADSVELDPQRLAQVENRLSDIFQTSRKYRTEPNELNALQKSLQLELEQLSDPESALENAKIEAEKALNAYLKAAEKLSQSRKEAAEQLVQQVNSHFESLSMQGAAIHYAIDNLPDRVKTKWGTDEIQLLVRTNPGQEYGNISKIASGGELSRISLAIQMVTARSGQTPTLIFDEVDVGIGGATADCVGELLRSLGERAQIICITHLPQVASKANQQLLVSKETSSDSAESRILPLTESDRVEEIARMLGGASISEQSRENARDMLKHSR